MENLRFGGKESFAIGLLKVVLIVFGEHVYAER